MLTVYGVAGRLFRGSLEQLRQIDSVGAVARSQSVSPVERGGRDAAAATLDAALGLEPVGPQDEASRVAIGAYTDTQKTDAQRHPLRQASEIMSQPVFTLFSTATVQDAWQSLAQHGIGQAPVVDAQGHLVGLMSRADLMHLDQLPSPENSALVWRALLLQSVTDRMHTPVPAVTPETDIRSVARALLDSELPGLPVVDDAGAVIGFVSRSDILQAVVTYPPLDLWG